MHVDVFTILFIFNSSVSLIQIEAKFAKMIFGDREHICTGDAYVHHTGTLNPVDYPGYPPELKLHEYEDNEEDVFCDAPTASSLPAGCKPCNQLDYFKKIIRSY